MSLKKNHYQILGLSTDVSAADIKRAYRRLAKAHHPDARHHIADTEESLAATEEMMRINEAYATLMDTAKRAAYDVKIGLRKAINIKKPIFTSFDEDQQRERYLSSVLYPIRNNIGKVLSAYKRELKDLSADPYDDELIWAFEQYVDKIEDTLRKSSDTMTRNAAPRTLQPTVLLMRQCIAQAADGLEELRYYLRNFDYNHLTTAESLFRIATDLSRQALASTKVGR
jgi:molecular chaperone DnaJ